MGCGAKRTREASMTRSNATRGTCGFPPSLPSPPPALAPHHGSHGVTDSVPGCPVSRAGHLPSQPPVRDAGLARPSRPPTRPGRAIHRTEGKARGHTAFLHTAWPPYLKPHSHPHSGNNTDGQLYLYLACFGLPAWPCPAIRDMSVNRLPSGAVQPLPLPRQAASRFLQ